MRRAVTLDPRSPLTLARVAGMAMQLRRWDDVVRYADQFISLDSADERGWTARLAVERAVGDSASLRRVLASALPHLQKRSLAVLYSMVAAGGTYPAQIGALSPSDIGLHGLPDTAGYLDLKHSAFTALGDSARAHAYLDSLRVLLGARTFPRSRGWPYLMILSRTDAALGRRAEARSALARAGDDARELSRRANLADLLGPVSRAEIHAQLGEPEAAVRWLEKSLSDPAGGSTATGMAWNPWLAPLRGTPAFQQLVRTHPVQSGARP